jgi:hypothetical protein
LVETINDRVHLFTRHLPSWESDHLLSLSDHVVTGGTCLQDLEALRQDPAYLAAVGADRLPDPTTVGDFLRRFTTEEPLLEFQEAITTVRQRIWQQQPPPFRQRAVLDVDGTHVATDGECTTGVDLSHTGIWGSAPVVIALDTTREVRSVVNRPGTSVSHQGAVPWIDRAMTLVTPTFKEVWLRGDTDCSLTEPCDRWNAQGVRCVFGCAAHPTLVRRAEGLPPEAWQRLERPPASLVTTRPRKRPPRVTAERVRARGFKHLRLVWEEVAECPYRPTTCRTSYRVVVLRTHLVVEKGGVVVDTTVRYVFSMTNDRPMAPAQVVAFSHDRCDEDNTIEQLKNGVRA